MNLDLLKYKERLKTKTSSNSTFIFDPIRKKYIVLTPEELVRQLFLLYLIEELKVPLKHIAVEKQITINNKNYRFDILVYEKSGNPKLIIECKSHKVNLTEATAIQVSKYNIALKAEYLCVTNGMQTLFYKIDFINHSIEKVSQIILN